MGRCRGAFAIAIGILVPLLIATGADAVRELGRKGFLGVQVAPGDGRGVLIQRVFPEGSAKESGLADGDVVLTLDGKGVATPQDFVKIAAARKSGEVLKVGVLRGGEEKAFAVPLREAPREKSDEFAVEYASVESKGALLRTIVTRPSDQAKHAGVLIIQGLMCASIENSPGPLSAYRRISEGLTKAGVVVMRVEKPGCGDSQGGPCSEVDFQTELDGYRQALRAMKSHPNVDPEDVYILGHSMGGLMAPLLAGETKVKGSVVYGTAIKSWADYLVENTRRQLELAGTHAKDDIDRRVEIEARFLKEHFAGKKPPKSVAEIDDELRAYVAESYPDGVHIFGRHHRFFQQLAEVDPTSAWKKASGHVTAVWGKADFVSSETDHAKIAEAVNQARPGAGKFLALNDSDHGFSRFATAKESMDAGLLGEFNPEIITVLTNFIESTRSS